jgi:hypothetical protein
MNESQWAFLEEVFLSNSISSALGHNPTYKKGAPKDASDILGRELRRALRELAARYSDPVSEEEHIQNIKALAKRISERCAAILEDRNFRLGPAQKAFNVYLKFLWCDGRISPPPHCPFDSELIGKLKLPPGCQVKWTMLDDEKSYRDWVSAAKVQAGAESLAAWELRVSLKWLSPTRR